MASYERFRQLLFEKNIRVADVIRGANVTRPVIINWENGKEPSLRSLRKIADFFGVSVKEFID